MSLIGTLEADVDIAASAQQFFGVMCNAPNQLTTIVPDIVKSCDLLDGLWGALGAITSWTYVLGGVTTTITLVIGAVNPITKSVTYGLIEGDLKSQFSTFAVQMDATQKIGGCTVHLAITYVKLTQDVSNPQALLDLGVQVIKGLGAYLAQA
ncbi:MLP-like protein 43, major latex protein like 43 [Hibiscus trionum]|uniref:MLP-like protein 43, major latex protein like 43 n=1 Tax=Hibiscus trionum TaxID=183268 RepID=A0A9W7MM05_HIBTR|nr:MLP-like protein 43, major latex protein like 43 [Hibiscus trionum]